MYKVFGKMKDIKFNHISSTVFQVVVTDEFSNKLTIDKVCFGEIDIHTVHPDGRYSLKNMFTSFGVSGQVLENPNKNPIHYEWNMEKEMTIADIEKELGYKVKIINEVR